MSATKKRKVRQLKEGCTIVIPKQTVKVCMRKEMDTPNGQDKLFVLKVRGMKGETKGLIWDMAAFSDEEYDLLLRNPWPRLLWTWFKTKVWGT